MINVLVITRYRPRGRERAHSRERMKEKRARFSEITAAFSFSRPCQSLDHFAVKQERVFQRADDRYYIGISNISAT